MTERTSEQAEVQSEIGTAGPIHIEHVTIAETVIGLTFTDAERELLLDDAHTHLESYEKLRAVPLENSDAPAFTFHPRVVGATLPESTHTPIQVSGIETPALSENLEAVAFWSVPQLAHLLQTRQVTSTALTEMYLQRLKRYDPALHCVAVLTEAIALKQAARADEQIASGQYHGLLHGIPYGVKDLLAVNGVSMSWGAEPYLDQVASVDATVVERLESAGAVLIAKLSVGALASGDVWHGGMIRNPWNFEEGSSGSSAGSASATVAGLVGFSIGTETYGSIVSPSVRCCVTGLRPTFGRVSRWCYGAVVDYGQNRPDLPHSRRLRDCV